MMNLRSRRDSSCKRDAAPIRLTIVVSPVLIGYGFRVMAVLPGESSAGHHVLIVVLDWSGWIGSVAFVIGVITSLGIMWFEWCRKVQSDEYETAAIVCLAIGSLGGFVGLIDAVVSHELGKG